jgi:hypothetical protein
MRDSDFTIFDQEMPGSGTPKQSVSPDELSAAVQSLEELAEDLIFASRRLLPNDRVIYLSGPDAEENGCRLGDVCSFLAAKPEMFQPDDLRDICGLFFTAQQADGRFPAAIACDGTPHYSTAAETALHAIDLAWHAAAILNSREFVESLLPGMIKGLQTVPRNDRTGLVRASDGGTAAVPVQSGWGAADRSPGQGDNLFTSLLFAHAGRQLADLLQGTGRDGDADMWRAESHFIAKRIRMHFWDKRAGLFRAATEGSGGHDLWGSALAVYYNIATSGQLMSIARYFADHYPELVFAGGLRELPPDECRTPGLDDAGGGQDETRYSSLPAGWLAYALDIRNPDLANRTIVDLAACFAAHGACQSITRGGTIDVGDCGPAAALPLAAVKRLLNRREKRDSNGILSPDPEAE